MTPFELISSLLAPHLCLICRAEGSPLCEGCARAHMEIPAEIFPSVGALTNVWVSARYTGVAKELVAQLKFQRVKAASKVIAWWMDRGLPPLSPVTIVSAVPTANKRVRMRGYDQAGLIARDFARRRGLKYQAVLYRIGSARQVGSDRQARLRQLEGAFATSSQRSLASARILLIDDVLTTGATVEQAASELFKHRVSRVDAAVFAH